MGEEKTKVNLRSSTRSAVGSRGGGRHRLFSYLTLVGLFVFTGFLLFWVFLVVPFLTYNKRFYTLNPIPAYFIYNLGFILFSAFFFNFLLNVFAGNAAPHVNLSKAILIGIDGWLGLSFVFDLLQPAFYLSPSGHVLIPLGTSSLENTAVDAMVATAWSYVLPGVVNTHWWFFLTYVLTPFLVVLFIALVSAPKVFLAGLARTIG
jgi:hypothetical protein